MVKEREREKKWGDEKEQEKEKEWEEIEEEEIVEEKRVVGGETVRKCYVHCVSFVFFTRRQQRKRKESEERRYTVYKKDGKEREKKVRQA